MSVSIVLLASSKADAAAWIAAAQPRQLMDVRAVVTPRESATARGVTAGHLFYTYGFKVLSPAVKRRLVEAALPSVATSPCGCAQRLEDAYAPRTSSLGAKER